MRKLTFTRFLGAAVVSLSAMSAQAALVYCGTPEVGIRYTAVDPALPDGYCYTQEGNLQNSDIAAIKFGGISLSLIEKDTWSDAGGVGNTSGLLLDSVDSAARINRRQLDA